MNNIRYLILIVALIGGFKSFSQTDDPFDRRLVDIQSQLNLLSDSIAPGLQETANFSVSGTTIQAFLRTLAESHDLNLQIDPSLNIHLTNNFTSVLVKDIIYFLCQEYRIDVRFTGSIMSFAKFIEPAVVIPKPLPKKLNVSIDNSSGRITFDFNNDSLRTVVKEITRLSNHNVVATGGPEIESKLITGYIKDMPLEGALEKLAYINGLKMTRTKDGVLILENAQANPNAVSNGMGMQQGVINQRPATHGELQVKDSVFTLDVVNYPILELIKEASERMGVNYILFSEITGNTTAKVKEARYEELLSMLFQGTQYTFKRKGNVYMMGLRTQEGFKSTELLKLEFRTIEGIEREIPTELMKDVELRILKELNAFIITGTQTKIDELTTFIRLIDKPIPNILIEVIVAEAKKSFTLETGIKALINPDSIPKTRGSVFPGLDVTLSSKSVNDILQSINSKGIANLGKVTPSFYATIKALEENNNIEVRSTPKLSTMNGNKANLTIGQSQYYLEQTQNIQGGVGPIQSISNHYIKVDANLSITISPVVSGNEHITLDINAEFSNFVPSLPNAPPGSQTRKFESKIRVRNEDVIILGGLEEISKSENGSGVPFLSRVPVLKWLFSSRKKEKVDNRLIVFIKPTLVY